MANQKEQSRTPAGEAMEDLMVEALATFFLLRAAGTKIGAVTPSGRGYWGLLRSLKQEGPQTVPQLARSRPVSRQHIQKLANEMIEEGVIELLNNPAHKRSKLLRLTPKGETVFQALSERIAQEAENFAEGIDATELQIAVKVLKQLREKLKEMMEIEEGVGNSEVGSRDSRDGDSNPNPLRHRR